jgi:hypothetical protein
VLETSLSQSNHAHARKLRVVCHEGSGLGKAGLVGCQEAGRQARVVSRMNQERVYSTVDPVETPRCRGKPS